MRVPSEYHRDGKDVVICAWCHDRKGLLNVMHYKDSCDGSSQVSHSICNACLDEIEEEDRAAEEAKKSRAA